MSNISYIQYRQMLEKMIRKHPITPTMEARAGVEREADLHDQILEYCKDKGWICVHSRMDQPSTNQVGTVDAIVATDDGRTLWVEMKRPGGKLTPAQHAFIHWLERNHQEVCVVRSLEEFVMFTRGLFRSIT